MKKVLLALFLIGGGVLVHAQDSSWKMAMPEVSATHQNWSNADINRMTTGIVNTIATPVKISEKQTAPVTNAISAFLTEKNKIMPLMTSNRAEYTRRFESLYGSLKSELSKTLSSKQMKKFGSLKPSTNDQYNVLSQVFY